MTPRIPGLGRFLLGLGLLIGLGAAMVATPLGQQPVATRWGGPVTIAVSNTEVLAGNEFDVTVMADAADGTDAQVAVFGALNSALFTAPVADGQATLTITGLHTRHSGAITLVGSVLGNVSEPVTFNVLPLQAVEPIVPLVGPRTIVADGTDITMVAISPADRFANAVAGSTDVATSLTHSDGTNELLTDQVDGGIASRIITATTETGRVIVSSSVGAAGGPSNAFDEVAGTPADFRVEIDNRNAVADGFNLREVRTTILRDRFGNMLPDGIGVVFTIESAAGSTFVNATVQGAIARTRVQAPSEPGTIEIRALVSGATSEPTSLTFIAAVEVLPIETTTADNWTTLTIGPVLSTLGGYVPDGTLVSVHSSADAFGSPLATAEVRGGSVEMRVPETDGPFEVEVLGLRAVIAEPGSGPGS